MKTLKKLLITAVATLAFATACTSKPETTYVPKPEQVIESVSTKPSNDLEYKTRENSTNTNQIQTSQYPKEEDLVGKLQWPLDNPVVTQTFGENKGDYYGPQGHMGLDMAESFGAEVKAAAEGIVLAKGTGECPNFENPDCNYGMGNWIMLYHPDLKIHTVYSHLKEKSYKSINEKIWQGETIGHEGGSGFQFYITIGPEKPITGDNRAHHLDLMVGIFKPYTTREGKTDIQFKKVYDPQAILPPLSK